MVSKLFIMRMFFAKKLEDITSSAESVSDIQKKGLGLYASSRMYR